MIFILSACDLDIVRAEPEIRTIYVDGINDYYYFVGDELVLEDAHLFVEYDNNEIVVVELDKSMIDSSFSTHFPGKTLVKINYKGASTSFYIEILDLNIDKIELNSLPDKTTYIEGTDFDVRGATIDVYFEGGRIINVNVLSNNVIMYNPDIIGPQMVKVSYRGRLLDIPIDVVSKTLESISVNTLPRNRAVFVGQQINSAGMVLNFHYDNGIIEEKRIEDLVNIEFSFNNRIATPSTQVVLKYTLYINVGEYKEFRTTFNTQVLQRVWNSMEIIQYPKTKGIIIAPARYDEFGNKVRDEVRTPSTGIEAIVQGDELDLSTGKVEVTFDDGTKEIYNMNNHLLKVYNEETIEKSEIKGLTIEPVSKSGVPAGDCKIEYTIRKSDSEYLYNVEPDIKITARRQDGRGVPVKGTVGNYIIEADENEIYSVTITATVIDRRVDSEGVEQDFLLTTVKSFKILTVGAVEPRKTLDISSAGEYKLSVIYMENLAWSCIMNVFVIGREPQALELLNYSDITQVEYVVGDKINISAIKYYIRYNNGDTDPAAPVTASMLSQESTLLCDFVTDSHNKKTIVFEIHGIASVSLNVTVVPLRVLYLEVDPPINVYVAQGAAINPQGASITVYMNNKTKSVLDLPAIMGTGYDFAQILDDPLSNSNSIINLRGDVLENNPYEATVSYKGAEVNFEYFVVDREVESIRLVASNPKTSYYENEDLDLTGLTIKVKWKNSSGEDTLNVTEDMLYKFDKHFIGPQTLRIRYRGVLNETFSIWIQARVIEEINIVRQPKTTYIYGIDRELDASNIRISRHFNDGSSDEQLGITLGLNEFGYGWTYNVGEIDFRLLGYPQIVKLKFYDEHHITDPLIVEYEIIVESDGVEAIYLYHPDGQGGSNIITSVPKGMDLNLYDAVIENGQIVLYQKVIYVKNFINTIIREVPLTPDMIEYEKTNITIEDRVVRIRYNGAECQGIIRVLDWELRAISVEKAPKTKYILGESLEVTGGIIKRTFRDAQNQQQYDYVPMNIEGISSSGFDESLQESDYQPDEEYKERIITLHYASYNCSYQVRIYKKFNATITYSSTVSFYGDVSLPSANVRVDVIEFTLPNINIYFINLEDVEESLPSDYVEEIVRNSLGDIVSTRYRVGEEYFLKVILADGLERYIAQSKIMTYNNYPTSPAKEQNAYLILVQVQGNKYYNAINYAEKEFRIINKYINVNAVVPNERAIIWEYNTSDNGRAVYLLSSYIEDLILSDTSLNIILASPTYESFEIIIISYGNWKLNVLKEQIENTITQTWWSYTQVVIDINGNPMLDDFGNIITKIIEVKQNDAPTGVDSPQERKLTILSWRERVGVNHKVYGEGEELISYYVPSGGLIAIRDENNFFVMELFTGQLYRFNFDRTDVLYEVDGELINGFYIEDEQVNQFDTVVSGYEIRIDIGQGSVLSNPNYFLSFQSQKYIIAPKLIVDIEFLNAVYDEDLGAQILSTSYDGQEKKIAVRYRTEPTGAQVNLDSSQVKYYYIDGEEEVPYGEGEFPVARGLYRARITHNYKAKEGYETSIIWECYLEIT